VDIAKNLSPTLGYVMLISACIAMLNEFNTSVAATARIVQVTALCASVLFAVQA
jgi:hypothetical protein